MARIATVKYDETHGLYHRTLGMDPKGRKPKFWLGPDKSVAEPGSNASNCSGPRSNKTGPLCRTSTRIGSKAT